MINNLALIIMTLENIQVGIKAGDIDNALTQISSLIRLTKSIRETELNRQLDSLKSKIDELNASQLIHIQHYCYNTSNVKKEE